MQEDGDQQAVAEEMKSLLVAQSAFGLQAPLRIYSAVDLLPLEDPLIGTPSGKGRAATGKPRR